jgi:hypothetical protein
MATKLLGRAFWVAVGVAATLVAVKALEKPREDLEEWQDAWDNSSAPAVDAL